MEEGDRWEIFHGMCMPVDQNNLSVYDKSGPEGLHFMYSTSS